jgi:hypothetical protein
LGIRSKKTRHPTEKYCDRVQQARVDYWREIEGIEPENLFFVDEAGVNLTSE